MRNKGTQIAIALIALGALAGASLALAGGKTSGAGKTIRDRRADTKALKRKPQLDIRRVSVADESGNRLKYKISMQGRLKPKKKFTRPFILINTRGGRKSDFEYLVLGPRVFKRAGKGFEKVGANRFKAKRRTWVYRFKPARIGLGPGDRFGWAALTTKGRTSDLAPNGRYARYRIRPVS